MLAEALNVNGLVAIALMSAAVVATSQQQCRQRHLRHLLQLHFHHLALLQ
jgi:hypothetical protein